MKAVRDILLVVIVYGLLYLVFIYLASKLDIILSLLPNGDINGTGQVIGTILLFGLLILFFNIFLRKEK